MAPGFFRHLAGDQAVAYCGGSEPADQINPSVIAAMAEKGIDIAAEQPKRWTDDMVQAAGVVVTMGCGDARPALPGRCYQEWVLPEPAGQPVEAVRPTRDNIEERVRRLLSELNVPTTDCASRHQAPTLRSSHLRQEPLDTRRSHHRNCRR